MLEKVWVTTTHLSSQEADAADQFRQRARVLCNTAGHSASIWAPSYLEQRYLQWNGWTDLALASYLGLKPVVEIILREEKTPTSTCKAEATARRCRQHRREATRRSCRY